MLSYLMGSLLTYFYRLLLTNLSWNIFSDIIAYLFRHCATNFKVFWHTSFLFHYWHHFLNMLTNLSWNLCAFFSRYIHLLPHGAVSALHHGQVAALVHIDSGTVIILAVLMRFLNTYLLIDLF